MIALQMLILVAVGDNGRITNAYTRCSRITNPTERIREIRVIRGLTEQPHYSLFTINYKLLTIHSK